jgi:hypothetical protein
MERFNLDDLNDVEVEHYKVQILNTFAVLVNLDVNLNINRAWKGFWKIFQIQLQRI